MVGLLVGPLEVVVLATDFVVLAADVVVPLGCEVKR